MKSPFRHTLHCRNYDDVRGERSRVTERIFTGMILDAAAVAIKL